MATVHSGKALEENSNYTLWLHYTQCLDIHSGALGLWAEKEVMHPCCRIIWLRFLRVNPHLSLYNSSRILVGYLLISFLRTPWSISHCHESLLDCSVLVSIMPTLLIESVVPPGLLPTENSHHRAIQRVVQLSRPWSTCLCVRTEFQGLAVG